MKLISAICARQPTRIRMRPPVKASQLKLAARPISRLVPKRRLP